MPDRAILTKRGSPMTDAKEVEILPTEVAEPAVAEEARGAATREVGRPEEQVPEVVVALPLNQRPVFPTMMLPLVIPAGRLSDAVRHAIAQLGGYVGFFLTRAPIEDGGSFHFADLFPVG